MGYPKSVNLTSVQTRMIKACEMTSAEMRTPRCLGIVGQIVSIRRLRLGKLRTYMYCKSCADPDIFSRGGGIFLLFLFNVI